MVITDAPSHVTGQAPKTTRASTERFQAVLAISSDLDETPSKEVYFETMRFLNTSESTSMGPGVDLEFGNTIYFDMPAGHFSYWNTDDAGREMIHRLIRSGHIDTLHSFGDLATTRAHAERALDALTANKCFIKVWIDHAIAPSNLGSDIMRGHGDEPGHPVYHADLTREYGVKFVWRGRVTSVIGQNRPVSYRGIWNSAHPAASCRTILKESLKRALGKTGNPKYRLQRHNRLIEEGTLRDGGKVTEFVRCNPHWGGVSCCDTGYGIGEVLNRKFLDTLVARNGWCILYTHLGKLSSKSPDRFDARALAGFRLLAEYYRSGKVLVTTTSRLLQLALDGEGLPLRSTWQKLQFPR